MAPVWHEIYIPQIWCCCCLKEPKRIFIFYLSRSSSEKKCNLRNEISFIYTASHHHHQRQQHICVAHKNNPFSLNLCKSCCWCCRCFSRSLLHEKFHELFDFRSFQFYRLERILKTWTRNVRKYNKNKYMWRITHENKFQLLCELLSKLFQ